MDPGRAPQSAILFDYCPKHYTVTSVNHDTMINYVGEAFVDDTGLWTNNLGVMSIDQPVLGEIGL
jgi:hypothetical protein